jgi:hypothetical protein
LADCPFRREPVMKGLRLAGAATALCVVLAVAPAAQGKTFRYQGPVDQADPVPPDPYQEDPAIELFVRVSKNKKGKLVPKSVKKAILSNVWFQCEHPVPDSGDPSTIFYPGSINDSTSEVLAGIEEPVKHGAFRMSDEDGGTWIDVGGDFKGKGGEASGFVQIGYESKPGDDFQVGSCNSGTLGWAASA